MARRSGPPARRGACLSPGALVIGLLPVPLVLAGLVGWAPVVAAYALETAVVALVQWARHVRAPRRHPAPRPQGTRERDGGAAPDAAGGWSSSPEQRYRARLERISERKHAAAAAAEAARPGEARRMLVAGVVLAFPTVGAALAAVSADGGQVVALVTTVALLLVGLLVTGVRHGVERAIGPAEMTVFRLALLWVLAGGTALVAAPGWRETLAATTFVAVVALCDAWGLSAPAARPGPDRAHR